MSAGPRGSGRPVYSARIERLADHADDTRSLFLRMVDGRGLTWIPGMFISVAIPLAEETRVRPYTIASSPEDGEPFELVFNRVPDGVGATWLFARKPGEILNFTGPFGAFTLERAPEREAVFIAEGTAIAPIRPMLRRALERMASHPVRLLYGADRADHLLFSREIEGWAAKYPQFQFETIIAGPARQELYARILDEVEHRWVGADDNRSRNFYICGVGAGVLKIRDLLRGAGYERRAVRYEQW